MHAVSVKHAKAHLDELLNEAVEGEPVAIAVGDDLVVRWTVERLTPKSKPTTTGWPVLGMLKGKVWIAADFDDIPAGFEEYIR